MAKHITTVTAKGQVTIPVHLRRALNIKPGDRAAFYLIDGEVRLRPVVSGVMAGYGAVAPLRKPTDFRRVRQQAEEDIGETAAVQ